MQSCSVQHCVLFLLTLTFTTDPGSAVCEFPVYAKLHQSVTLPCRAQCSGRGWWSLDSNRDVVFARCDQTSCTSVKDGYEMSYDQYNKGDLSLTITKPDYSMRNKYTCECDYTDYATMRLRISTVSSAVQMSPGEDLKLHVSVPESVEVIYRRSDSADDVQICTVTNRTLQCNTEYTPRTSLSYPELTLRHMERSESGTYTIRNLDYKEDIRVYAVSVSGYTTGETAGIVIPVLLLVAALLIAGVLYYRKKAVEWGVNLLNKNVKHLINKGVLKNTSPDFLKEENLRKIKLDLEKVVKKVEEAEVVVNEAEEKINALEQKYKGDEEHSEYVKQFCKEKRKHLQDLTAATQTGPTAAQVNKAMAMVEETVNKAMRAMKKARTEINDLEQKYSEDDTNKEYITLFCNDKRRDLGLWSDITAAEDSPPWGVYMIDQDPEALAQQMETASRILEGLKRDASAENRVVSQPDKIRMFTRVEKCLQNVNSWSRKDKSDIALQIKKWSVDKMMELKYYRGELLPAETPETPRNTDRGETEPFV